MLKLRPLPSHMPFRPGNRPLYYGWWVMLGVVLTQVLSSPGQTAGVSPFIEPLMEATGLSRQAISNAYLVGTLLSGICMLQVGRIIDLWGSRWVNLLAGLTMAVVLLALSRIDSALRLLQYALGNGLLWQAGALILLGVGFFALRFCGQGAMTLTAQTTTPRWFRRRRGLATGVAGLVGAVIGPAAPLLLNALIGEYGWRGAWVAAGIIVAVVNSFVAFLIWRDTPESCGLEIDGTPPAREDPLNAVIEDNWTRAEAVRAPAFWVVAATNAMLGLIITAISFHIVDIGHQRGLSDQQALGWFMPMAWVGVLVGFGANVMADRLSFRIFLPALQFFIAAAILCLAFTSSPTGFYASSIVTGLALAMAGPASVTTFPRWFGRTHLGAISGVNWAGTVIGSALGPALFVLLRTESLGYRPAQIACAVPLVGLFIASLLVAAPCRK